jgi:hypothetical protein
MSLCEITKVKEVPILALGTVHKLPIIFIVKVTSTRGFLLVRIQHTIQRCLSFQAKSNARNILSVIHKPS